LGQLVEIATGAPAKVALYALPTTTAFAGALVVSSALEVGLKALVLGTQRRRRRAVRALRLTSRQVLPAVASRRTTLGGTPVTERLTGVSVAPEEGVPQQQAATIIPSALARAVEAMKRELGPAELEAATACTDRLRRFAEQVNSYPIDTGDAAGSGDKKSEAKGDVTPGRACGRFRATLRFREQRGLDAIRRGIVEGGGAVEPPHAEAVAAVMPYNLLHRSDRNGDVVSVLLLGLFDESAVLVPRAQFTEMFVLNFLHRMERFRWSLSGARARQGAS